MSDLRLTVRRATPSVARTLLLIIAQAAACACVAQRAQAEDAARGPERPVAGAEVAQRDNPQAPAADGADGPARPDADVPPAGAAKPPVEAAAAGQLIRIPLPITGNVDLRVKRMVESALKKAPHGKDRLVLVLELSPAKTPFGEGSDFSRALSLARYLSSRELSVAKTVAFIPKPIKGHAVLVALACEEIVMAPEATIGQAGLDEPADEPLDPTIRANYREIANRRRTVPAEVALGMLDKQLEVLKVETEVSPEYVLRSDLEKLQKRHTVQSINVLKPAGQFGQFTGREARALGIVKYLAADRRALAGALSLSKRALEEDPSLAGDWRPIRMSVQGPIKGPSLDRLRKTITAEIESRGINFVCVSIDSPGGSVQDSMNFANFLADFDSGTVRTVAYIPKEARGDAALVALACDEIVMHPDAVLGGSGAEAIAPDEAQELRISIKAHLAPRKTRSWSLPAALFDPKLTVYACQNRTTGATEYLSAEELKEKDNPDQWQRGKPITESDRALRLNGRDAERFGLARHLVDDFAELRQIYGIQQEFEHVEPRWVDMLVDALAAPGVRWILVLIGIAALYAELHTPGIGLGAFISGICFLLYFWSSGLEGTAGWLEVLLFAAGVTCVLLELFILPGTGVFGLGGGLLIIISLVLASQTFIWPRNDYQMAQMRDSILSLAGVAVGFVAIAWLVRRLMPHTPMFGHMILEPPSGVELEDLSHREALVELDHLTGQRGLAFTQLTPSGKARFGDQLVDVIADGGFIARGSQVEVIEVHGNRVLVRSA